MADSVLVGAVRETSGRGGDENGARCRRARALVVEPESPPGSPPKLDGFVTRRTKLYVFDVGGTLVEGGAPSADIVEGLAALVNSGKTVALLTARAMPNLTGWVEGPDGLIGRIHRGARDRLHVWADRVTKHYVVGADGKLDEACRIPFPASVRKTDVLRIARGACRRIGEALQANPSISTNVKSILAASPLRASAGDEYVQLCGDREIHVEGDATSGVARREIRIALEETLARHGALPPDLVVAADGRKGVYVKSREARKPEVMKALASACGVSSTETVYVADQFEGASAADLPVADVGVPCVNVGDPLLRTRVNVLNWPGGLRAASSFLREATKQAETVPCVVTGADLAVSALKTHGVTRIWGIPGDVTHFFAALSRNPGIDFVAVRHEQEGVFAAQGYAVTTGTPGVAYGSLGPGATNMVTAVANAHQDRTPMVVIVDQLKKEAKRPGFHQYIDLQTMLRPVAKEVWEVERAREIPSVLRNAFRVAREPRRGPVVVILREDVLAEEVAAGDVAEPALVGALRSDDGCSARCIDEFLAVLDESRSAVAVLGLGMSAGGVGGAARTFLERTNIPFFTTLMAKGVIPDAHRLCLGSINRHLADAYAEVFRNADTVLALGFDSIEGVRPDIWRQGRPKTVICVDEVLPDPNGDFQPTRAFRVPLAAFFRSVLDRTLSPQCTTVDARRIRNEAVRLLVGGSLQRERVAEIVSSLADFLPEGAVVVTDVGNHKQFVGACLEARRALVTPNGLSAIGFALSAGMGIQEALPDRTVVAVHGDGGFLLNCQAMETIRRRSLPIIVVLLEDRSFGMIREKQRSAAEIEVGVTFGNPNFRQLAEAFGWDYRRADSVFEFRRALADLLARGFPSKAPTLLHVPVAYL